MKSFLMLLKREFWENRGAFWTTPLAIGGLQIFMILASLVFVSLAVVKIDGQDFVMSQLTQWMAQEDPVSLEHELDVGLMANALLFNLVLFFVQAFYLLGALLDDRKDRSILFWRSLPISDLKTVTSKLVFASVVAPIMMIIAVLITQLVMMLIMSVLLLNGGVNPWTYLWAPADPLALAGTLLLAYGVQFLWMLPVWGWLLMVSAWAKGRAFVWAVLPWVIAGFLQSNFVVTQYFSLDIDRHFIFKYIFLERLLGGVLPVVIQFGDDETTGIISRASEADSVFQYMFSDMAFRLSQPQMWWGVLIGIGFIAIAVYVRRFRDDA